MGEGEFYESENRGRGGRSGIPRPASGNQAASTPPAKPTNAATDTQPMNQRT